MSKSDVLTLLDYVIHQHIEYPHCEIKHSLGEEFTIDVYDYEIRDGYRMHNYLNSIDGVVDGQTVTIDDKDINVANPEFLKEFADIIVRKTGCDVTLQKL